MWAAGCVVAECVRRGLDESEEPSAKSGEAEWTLFDAGDLGSELALIKSIFETLGTPSDEIWPVGSFTSIYGTTCKDTNTQPMLTVTSGSQNLPGLGQNGIPCLPTQAMERHTPTGL